MHEFLLKLKRENYLYAMMPKRNRKKFYVTKAEMIDGTFADDDLIDEYTLEDNEKWDLDKGVWYKL